jgi:hypothetical protein
MTQRPARVEEESRGRMLGLILAANVSQAICTAVELGLPEALAGGPQNVDDLAVGCHVHRGQLGRLMTVLASFGVLARSGGEYFELTALGETLLGPEDDGRSLAGLAAFAGSRWLSEARVDAVASRLDVDPVAPTNPYWSEHGTTFEDPDGFGVVLVPKCWQP